MKIYWNNGKAKKNITQYVESVEWSGTDTQVSRVVNFSVAHDYYGKTTLNIKLGDFIYLKEDIEIFYGVVTSMERTGDIGTVSYTAKDLMHYLLRSNGSYNFSNTTAEKITQKVCADLKIETSSLYKTNVNIESKLYENASFYKIIIDSYNTAAKKLNEKNPKAFMPVMNKTKLSVIKKGQPSGVTLKQNADITSSKYSQNTDEMVNRIKIVDEGGNQIGQVDNQKHIKKYGIYQSIYKEERDVNAQEAAGQLLCGITKEATIEAVGYRQCISGYSVKIKDTASGLVGNFYIESDKHTWKDGTHTMSLTLKFKNELEEV